MEEVSITAFLEGQSQATLANLYKHSLTCLAVFRLLPTLAKHYVMRLLCVKSEVGDQTISSWVTDNNQFRHKEAMDKLKKLRILSEHVYKVSGDDRIKDKVQCKYTLHSDFRSGLQTALAGRGPFPLHTKQDGEVEDPVETQKRIAELDKYSRTRWEQLLEFMVAYKPDLKFPRGIKVLELANLVRYSSNGKYEITSHGWRFLLQDTTTQVWHVMLRFLENREQLPEDPKDRKDSSKPRPPFLLEEALNFLFQLSFSTFGKGYSVSELTEVQVDMLYDLRCFGLIKMKNTGAPDYFPTRLAINLASGLGQSQEGVEKRSYIVVETNMRVYAYTDNILEIAMLGNFIKLLYRFPGFVGGIICRESIRSALMKGISAEQICHFMRTHAHPQMKTQKPIIPPNVSHQIQLWELERDRLKFEESVLYMDFNSNQEFTAFLSYAQSLGVVLWHNEGKRKLVVSKSGHKRLKQWRKENKK